MRNDYFLGCDWGTSTFRLSLAKTGENRTLSTLEDNEGVRPVQLRHMKEGGESNRTTFMRHLLAKKVNQLESKSGRSLGGLPIVLSGMASSSIGLAELPYADLPFPLDQMSPVSRFFEPDEVLNHPLLLISGVRDQLDVMRGEETQLMGLAGLHDFGRTVCLLPGTHSKHIYLESCRITQFRTYMTGEVFELLSKQSILADTVIEPDVGESGGSSAFLSGVEQGVSENLLHSLFTIRAAALFGKRSPQESYLYLSGLVIGSELRDLTDTHHSVLLAAAGRLLQLYSLALDHLGVSFVQDDRLAEHTLNGQRRCLNQIPDWTD